MALSDVAIAGVYASRQARTLEGSTAELCIEVVNGVLEDAGLQRTDVDGISVEWPGQPIHMESSAAWARVLGTTLHWTADHLLDKCGIRGLAKAASAISAGLCEVALIGGGAATGPPGETVEAPPSSIQSVTANEFSDCWGAFPATKYALIAQRHMAEFGTTPEHLAEVAATIRNAGSRNPAAVMYERGPYTVEDVLSSPMICTPFHLLDLCLVAQGGAALLLTTTERARDLRHPVVTIAGIGMEYPEAPYNHVPLYRETGRIGTMAAKRAFGMAKLGPADVDVFNLYDPNSFEVIRQMEMLGLCGEGEGGPFIEGGAIALGGPYPTNVDGGLLSYSWNGIQQMTLKLVESVKQLRGAAAEHQVSDAEVAIASNYGAGSHEYELAILVRQ
jgi:acetyl-CoA acetyltransferase